ncbi:MAG: intermembrane transport protein PqiB [Lautropia sp.]
MPPPHRARHRRWLPSLIWLIPIVAALVGITLVARVLLERGPVITISFQTAEGLEAGKTRIKYKDVDIGTVRAISLAADRTNVVVTVQLLKEARGFTASDTSFWVIRPRADFSGISGLGTLLSGAYIGVDAGVATTTSNSFIGLEAPPIVTRDASGRQYTLRSADIGSLDIGAPVYFRRVKVGQVAAYSLDPDGRGVTLRVFVNAPYDRFVGVNTRFWHASGVDVQFDAGGLKLRSQALATVILGGIAFQSPDGVTGPRAGENTVFALASDEAAALAPKDGPPQSILLYFNQSLRGLSPGAAVDFRGVVIGEVKSIGIEFDPREREFRMPVLLQIYPERLGRRIRGRGDDTGNGAAGAAAGSPEAQRDQLRFLVSRGLRAQLRTGNLLTGQLYVALDFFPSASAVEGELAAGDPIELPTVPNSLDELQTQIADIARKLNQVPFEQIGGDLQKSLASLNRTLASAEQTVRSLRNDVAPEITAAMRDARKTLDSVQRTLRDDSPLQEDLRQALREVARSAVSVRVLTDYLERHPESLLRGKPPDAR